MSKAFVFRFLSPFLMAPLLVLSACGSSPVTSPVSEASGQTVAQSQGASTTSSARIALDAGLELYSQGRLQEAIAAYDEAIRLDPEDALPYFSRGAAYSDLGEFQRAIEDLDEAIRLNSRHHGLAYGAPGGLYGRLGQHERAIQDYDEAIRLAPGNADAYYNRAIANTLLGNDSEAANDVEQAIALGADRASIEADIEAAKNMRQA